MLLHFVEFFYPGSFMSESSEIQIEDRSLPPSIPERAYAYRFFERQEVVLDGEVLKGPKKNFSARTLIGEEFSRARVDADFGENSVLARNMRANRWARVARTRQGFVPLDDGDRVVSTFR